MKPKLTTPASSGKALSMEKVFKKAPNVALFLDTSEKAGREKFEGITRYMHLHTPWNILLFENYRAGHKIDLKAWGANGVLVARMPEALNLITSMDVPTVIMDSPALYADKLPKASFVTNDSDAVGKEAAKSLMKQGFKNFAYITNPQKWDWSIIRGASFKAHLALSGFSCCTYQVPATCENEDLLTEQQHLVDWLKNLTKPAAVFVSHDARALQVLNACQQANIRVPTEIALLGVDNNEFICENTTPTLSSVQPDFVTGGYLAASILEQMLRQSSYTPQNIMYGIKQVVLRESSRYAHNIDQRCLAGLEFIRLNSSEPIGVPDVARHMGVSRRSAELMFRKHVGHSILTELQKMRLARLKSFLTETNMPIGEISWLCGYSELHAKRIFKQITGMTMSQYRKKRQKLKPDIISSRPLPSS